MESLDRAALVALVVGQVATLELEDAATGEDPGDEALLNADASFPAVWVGYRGGVFAGGLESGATTYRATARVEVIVQTADPDPADRTGHAQALRLLQLTEAGLEGFAVWPGHRLRLVAEERTFAAAGLWEYVQTYEVRPLLSRPY